MSKPDFVFRVREVSGEQCGLITFSQTSARSTWVRPVPAELRAVSCPGEETQRETLSHYIGPGSSRNV